MLVIGDCIVILQAVLDYTYHDETHLTDEEFPEKNSRERIANIFGKSDVTLACHVMPCINHRDENICQHKKKYDSRPPV